MGLLVGLPLRLFHIVFVLLRFLWPLAVLWLVRRLLLAMRRRREEGPAMHQAPKEPEFDGPVYTVDYEDVKDEDPPKEET